MKTLMTMIASMLIAFTAKASDPVPYIAMLVDKGYAIDAHGKRQPSSLCKRDVIWARGPRYPFSPPHNDPARWPRDLRGDGLYRLDINLKTGRVSQIAIIKSAGSKLDSASVAAFSRWVFTPGRWSAMIIPTTVSIYWIPVVIQLREA
jgi:hypothetical protein